jgi:hypothetical protein
VRLCRRFLGCCTGRARRLTRGLHFPNTQTPPCLGRWPGSPQLCTKFVARRAVFTIYRFSAATVKQKAPPSLQIIPAAAPRPDGQVVRDAAPQIPRCAGGISGIPTVVIDPTVPNVRVVTNKWVFPNPHLTTRACSLWRCDFPKESRHVHGGRDRTGLTEPNRDRASGDCGAAVGRRRPSRRRTVQCERELAG